MSAIIFKIIHEHVVEIVERPSPKEITFPCNLSQRQGIVAHALETLNLVSCSDSVYNVTR